MLIARVTTSDTQGYALIDREAGLARVLARPPFVDVEPTGQTVPLTSVRLLAPVEPTKVLVAGRNYSEVATPDVVVFLKPSTAVAGPDHPVVLPAESAEVRFEGELAVLIGRRCRDVPLAKVDQFVFGYTCANDVTAWDVGASNGHWTKAKSFDTFCPLGPWIRDDLDPGDLELHTVVNGELRQRGSTRQMNRNVRELIARCSQLMTLLPGDVILTGTPAGSGKLGHGDSVSVTIDGIGTLVSPVLDSRYDVHRT